MPRVDVGEANFSLSVPKASQMDLPFSMPAGGSQASPSQSGLLFMYRNAPVGQESSTVTMYDTYMPTLFGGTAAP